MNSEGGNTLPVIVDTGSSSDGANDVEGGVVESVLEDPLGCAISPSQHSFLDMVTILEDGAYEVSQYCDTLNPRLECIEEDGGHFETAKVKEHSNQDMQKKNCAIIVEEVLAKARESVHLPNMLHLLPMVVLSPNDKGFWCEGEGYETACDQFGHWSAQDIATEHISVSTDVTPFQFARYFKDKEHQNYIGKTACGNPLLMSMSLDNGGPYDPVYRVIMRTNSKTWHNEYTAKSFRREPTVWDFISLEREGAGDENLSVTDLALVHGPKTADHIQKFDEHTICARYKFGVLYQKFGQKTEAEMFGNEHHSPAMEEFLNVLGMRVKLKGFDRYKAGLDTKDNMTGKESLYTEFNGKEIMFHVSTLLPYEPNDWQQIERKRHIGNDVVAIIFQDENTPFCPSCIKSNFLHVLVVVQVEHPNSTDTVYKVAVVGRDVVEQFPPALPIPPVFKKGPEFRDFLLTKMINAEITARSTSKFKELNLRTREQLLGQLVKELSSANSDSNHSGKRSRGRHKSDNASENKVKTKRKPSLNLGNLLLGKFRDTSDEYQLSPRGSRRKPDIIHLGALKNPRHGSYNDLVTLGNEYSRAEQMKPVPPAEAPKRCLTVDFEVQLASQNVTAKTMALKREKSVTLPQRPVSIECDKVTGDQEEVVRPRKYSHDGSVLATVEALEEHRRQPPVKKRKSILERVKNMSAKKKVHHPTSSGNSHVILLGITGKGEEEPVCHSLEDVRVPEFRAKVYSTQKDKHPHGHSINDEHVMPTLSQSVPSSPVLERHGCLPVLKSHKDNTQAARSITTKQSYSASQLPHQKVVSVPNVRESPTSPLLKLQQPNPLSVPGLSYFRSSTSPNLENSQSSIRSQATNCGSFTETNDTPRVAAQSSQDSDGHTMPLEMDYWSGGLMDHTTELLLRKLEELNSELTCVRQENLQLLRRQAMMEVTINKLVREKLELERDLAYAGSHMEQLVPRTSPVRDD